MHETVLRLGNADCHVSALIARWRLATRILTWVDCGHPPAYVADADGNLTELDSPPGAGGDLRHVLAESSRAHGGTVSFAVDRGSMLEQRRRELTNPGEEDR